MDAVTALNIALGLTQLSIRVVEAASRINTIIATAQSEQRDLTTAEVQDIIDLRKTAQDRWESMLP